MVGRAFVCFLLLAQAGCGRVGFALLPLPDDDSRGSLREGGAALVDAEADDGGAATRDAELDAADDGHVDPDAMALDAGLDAALDASPEGSTDAAAEASLDASLDADVDATSVDAGIDATVDANVRLCDPSAPPETQDTDGDGVLDIFDDDDDDDGLTDLEECFAQPPQLLVNSSFEQPAMSAQFIDQSAMPGWSTTASDGVVEVWADGQESVPAPDGQQFVECNANVVGALFQDVATQPGTTLRWAFYHRGRLGTDTLELRLGPPGATVSQGSFSTDETTWVLYTGTYDVPPGQTVTRFEYGCEVGSAFGSAGNFLDHAHMEPVCPIDSDGDGCPDSKDL